MKKHNLAFIDVETTGFIPGHHEVIEIGGVVARLISQAGRGPGLEVVDEFEYKIKPTRLETAEAKALEINGYNEAEWMFAPDLTSVMTEVAAKTAGATLVAHNLCFDEAFLKAAFKEAGVESKMHYGKLDTISMAYAKLYHNPAVEKFSLRALAEHFNITNQRAHTALADARVTKELFARLLEL